MTLPSNAVSASLFVTSGIGFTSNPDSFISSFSSVTASDISLIVALIKSFSSMAYNGESLTTARRQVTTNLNPALTGYAAVRDSYLGVILFGRANVANISDNAKPSGEKGRQPRGPALLCNLFSVEQSRFVFQPFLAQFLQLLAFVGNGLLQLRLLLAEVGQFFEEGDFDAVLLQLPLLRAEEVPVEGFVTFVLVSCQRLARLFVHVRRVDGEEPAEDVADGQAEHFALFPIGGNHYPQGNG